MDAAQHDDACDCASCIAAYLNAHPATATRTSPTAFWARVRSAEPTAALCPHCSGNACAACAYTGESYDFDAADDAAIARAEWRAERDLYGEG